MPEGIIPDVKRFLKIAAIVAISIGSAQSPAAEKVAALEASFVPPDGTSFFIRSQEGADGRIFLALNEVISALGGTVAYDAQTRSYELKVKQHSAVFGTEAPIVVVDTKLISVPVPVRGEGATAYADPEFFNKVVGPILGLTFVWEKTGRTLTARGTESADISVEATLADFEETTKVVLRFSQPPTFRVEKSAEQVLLRFPGTRLVAAGPDRTFDDLRVERVQIRGSEIAIVLKEKGLATNVYPLGSPPRLVIDVSEARALPPPESAPTAPQPSVTPRPERRIEPKTVVLDAGHGGTENGAAGPGGLLEKEATLSLVRTMRDTLTRRGYRVLTTRDSDASVGLEDRAAAANAAHADVFLSIHCNASRTPTAHGTEVYYLSLDASDRMAAAVAESENRAEERPTPSSASNAAGRDLELILWDLAQNQHLSASSRLAEIIQGDFNRLLGVTTRGVKQAPFKVLIGVNAPAVLVEVAFITNPDEEKKLASEEFRHLTAETVAGSLERFFKHADAISPVPYVPGAGARR